MTTGRINQVTTKRARRATRRIPPHRHPLTDETNPGGLATRVQVGLAFVTLEVLTSRIYWTRSPHLHCTRKGGWHGARLLIAHILIPRSHRFRALLSSSGGRRSRPSMGTLTSRPSHNGASAAVMDPRVVHCTTGLAISK